MIRVRFAPSPTGYLHIGGVRTALFNFLFAKSQNGKFLLRIEDTDLERSKPEYEKEITRAMDWLGLMSDEPLVRQSGNFESYKQTAEELVRQGKAFESTEKGGRAVVYKLPNTRVKFKDLVHGEIEFDTTTFEDLVLIKSDGSPTYNFACVMDDHAMGITHVIRGDDHISNTPKQILLYQLLGYPVPEFAHLPLIVGSDGTPLSKRHGNVSLRTYQEEGFLPEALLNYLALLGWSPGDNREIFSLEELTRLFRMEQVNSKSAAFDMLKLKWLNGEHLRTLDNQTYLKELQTYLTREGGLPPEISWEGVAQAAVLYKERIKAFKEFLEQAEYFFQKEITYQPEAVAKHWKDEKVKERLSFLADELKDLEYNDPLVLETKTREAAGKLGVKAGELIHPLRVALTGRSVSPGLFELMIAMGKPLVQKRIQTAIQQFSQVKEKCCG